MSLPPNQINQGTKPMCVGYNVIAIHLDRKRGLTDYDLMVSNKVLRISSEKQKTKVTLCGIKQLEAAQ